MKDTNRKIITEEEFTKDVGHRTEMPIDTKQEVSIQREINTPKGKSEIWIADDIKISSKTRYSKFHKFIAKILLGWHIIDVK